MECGRRLRRRWRRVGFGFSSRGRGKLDWRGGSRCPHRWQYRVGFAGGAGSFDSRREPREVIEEDLAKAALVKCGCGVIHGHDEAAIELADDAVNA